MTDTDWIRFLQYPELVAFNRAILEHPESDLPRLVFADWFEENCPSPPVVAAVRRSISQPDSVEWVPDFSMDLHGYELRLWRGRLQLAVEHTDPEFEFTPDPFIQAVYQSGWLARVKLRGLQEQNQVVRLSETTTPGIEWLDCYDSGISPRLLNTFLDCGPFPNLRTLDLGGITLSEAMAWQVAAHPALPNLKTLKVELPSEPERVIHALLQSPYLPPCVLEQFLQASSNSRHRERTSLP